MLFARKFLILFCFLVSSLAFADIFVQLDQFRADPDARKYKHNYDLLINDLENFIKSNPEHVNSKRALWAIANLREDIASITKQEQAIRLAIKAYKLISKTYSKTPLQVGADEKIKNLNQKLAKNLEKSKPKINHSKNNSLKNIRLKKSGDNQNIIFSFSSSPDLKFGIIPATEKLPKRLYLDVPGVEVSGEFLEPLLINNNGIKQIRSGQFKENMARFVIELEKGAKAYVSYDKSKNKKYFEIQVKSNHVYKQEVVDKNIKITKKQIVGNKKKVNQNQFLFKKIVLDPGHGGRDSGAVGRKGLKEKTVTLAVAKKVKELLKKQLPNVKVYLTRNNDKSLELSDRTKFANAKDADLFVSIHVNSSPNRETTGIETYYLDVSHNRYANRLAARENAVTEGSVSDLEFILADMSMKTNVNESVQLGELIQASTVNSVAQEYGKARDLGLKHALFYVLLGARMPAVLVETGFVSNRQEERKLGTKKFQDSLAEGIVKGIRRYVEQKQASYAPN